MKAQLFGSIKSWHWYWMPATVFLIGIVSIILLLWVGRISKRLHLNEMLIDAVMDVQIHTATGHLRLEEIIRGEPEVDVKTAIAELDQAIHLINVILDGGEAENEDWITEPLKDPEWRASADAIRSLLIQFKALSMERLKESERYEKSAALYQLFHATFKKVLSKTRQLEDIIEKDEALNQKKSGRLFLAIPAIWGLIVVFAAAGLWSREQQRRKVEEELEKANEQLLSQTEELTNHRERLSELVEERTAELKTANELLRVEMAERMKASEALKETEKQILYLSFRLLKAQEIERKRISMELHDELGQALSVVKLQLGGMEKGLREDQGELRQDCEKLRGYVDQIIEDVRRLSLDLSPTVLEDLGLTAALQWLVRNLMTIPNIKITLDIAGIDHLFSKHNWITIYRIVQEALTNIMRHAHAEHVSVVVRRDDDSVVFSVEDDGKGFNQAQEMMKDASEKGLGLTTMNERVRIMGGVLHLWSQEGKGTRIRFSIPIEKGEP